MGHAFRLPSRGRDPPHIRRAACPTGKVDVAAVTRPARHVLVARALRQPTRRAAIDVDRPDAQLPVLALGVEGDTPAVRRPAGRAL